MFLLLCLALLLAGCDTKPDGKVLGPAPVEQPNADADGTTVNGKFVPMVGPLLPGQVRPMIRIGDPDGTGLADPDADEVLNGDPTADD